MQDKIDSELDLEELVNDVDAMKEFENIGKQSWLKPFFPSGEIHGRKYGSFEVYTDRIGGETIKEEGIVVGLKSKGLDHADQFEYKLFSVGNGEKMTDEGELIRIQNKSYIRQM